MNEKEIWNYYAEADPYFSIVSVEKFRNKNINDKALVEFYASGEEYLQQIWREIERLNGGEFVPKRSLDFGCGVGRLTFPIASRSDEVVGTDVSPIMLEIAREAARRQRVKNVKFLETTKPNFGLSEGEKFDFVHSFVVLQHIRPEHGEKWILEMLKSLKDGGIGVFQITYETKDSWISSNYRRFPLIYHIRNLIKRGDRFLLPMHEYDLNKVFSLLEQNDCLKCHVRFTDHSSKGLMLFFSKSGSRVT